MKKRILLFMMIIACILSMTACSGAQDVTSNDYMTASQAITNAEAYTQQVSAIYDQYADDLDTFYQSCKQADSDDATVIMNAVQSWADAKEELGDNIMVVTGASTAEVSEDEVIVNVVVQGDAVYDGGKFRTATEQVIFEKMTPTSMSTTVDYTMGEMMSKAGMNTVIGMVTVFCILIIILLCIMAMGYWVPKFQARTSTMKKQPVKEETVAAPVAVTTQAEESVDDTELVAVITAAIAASEGTSSDGFVVRSIIRR